MRSQVRHRLFFPRSHHNKFHVLLGALKVESIFYYSLKVKSAADVAELGLDKEPRCAGDRPKEGLEQTFLSSGKDRDSPTKNTEANFIFPTNFLQSNFFFFLIQDIRSILSELGLTIQVNYQHKHL